MRILTGIQFVTDQKGRKVAVQIDLKKHGAVLEDFWDGLISESRRKEKDIPLEKIKADLIKTRSPSLSGYTVQVKPSARKELEALPNNVLARGYKDQWRVRIGDWRVIYIIDDGSKLINVTRIAHRREAYE